MAHNRCEQPHRELPLLHDSISRAKRSVIRGRSPIQNSVQRLYVFRGLVVALCAHLCFHDIALCSSDGASSASSTQYSPTMIKSWYLSASSTSRCRSILHGHPQPASVRPKSRWLTSPHFRCDRAPCPRSYLSHRCGEGILFGAGWIALRRLQLLPI